MKLEQLGPYKIERKIGRGGMGTVYEAVNTQTGEAAAVKLLNPHHADEEGFRERFAIEIETLKKLKHPNIVRLFGHGVQEGQLYYAMELVRGINLEEELQAGRRFDWRETTRTGIRLCKALKHAHDHGVVHRDIKPANLILTDNGDIKLTDFGIARLFGNTRLTSDGGLIGTAEYMAPEQAEGKQAMYHADLYSLGCVMFAMLAGRPPFRSKSLPEMLQLQRLAEPPPVSRFAQDVPQELERIIARLLSKTPSERGHNADLLARQLSAMEHGLSLPQRSPPTQHGPEKGSFSSFASAKTVPDKGEAPPAIEYDPDAPTRIAEPEPDAPPLRPRVTAKPEKPVRAATALPLDEHAELQLPETEPAPPRNRFVTVEEEEHQRELARRGERGPVVAQIVLLTASLVALIALAVYFMRPPSADALYSRIEERAHDENAELLLDAEDDVENFLQRFPDDPRAAQLKEYQEEIELLRLERRFARRSRQLTRDTGLLPIERDYIEAINYISVNPQRTADELRALVAVYSSALGGEGAVQSGAGAGEDRAAQVLELARRQVSRLEQHAREQAPAYLAIIDRGLHRAEQLKHENPQQARMIWQSIVTLYGDKPWASQRVQTARDELEQTGRKANDETNDQTR